VNPNTGEIHFDVSDEDVKKRGLVPIPGSDLESVVNMNRKQRRAWAARQRKSKSAE
jgi:hypothetical protein